MSNQKHSELFELEEISAITPCSRNAFNDELMSIVSDENCVTPGTNFDILLNKHLNNHEITDVQLQQLPENQRNTLVQIQRKDENKKKRPDECQKLFYKRAFKYSQHKFFKRCKNKSRKMSRFYHHHFDKTAKEEEVPITSFYHPNRKTKPGLAIGHRTFNYRYIKLLLKSNSFREDLKQYHEVFINDCLKERKRKVITFTKSLQRIMQRAQEDSRILVKYLQSSQCKIPWTYREIKETWEIAQRDLKEFLQPDPSIQASGGMKMNQCEQIPLGLIQYDML